MMAVVGLPHEPAANVSVAADWAASALASATDGFTYTVNDGRAFITGYTGTETALKIPSTIDGLPVDTIAASAFSGRTDLKSITLPDSITSIGHDAFFGCTGLTSINIPDGVTRIGWQAFSYCSNLTDLDLPSALASIETGTFSACTGLTSITIPARVASIDSLAFQGCTRLVTIAVEAGSKHYISISGLLFSVDGQRLVSCPAGKQGPIVIPAGVTAIEESAFNLCSSLTGVTLPVGLKSIGSNAFSNCNSLMSITIPASVVSIGSSVFFGCYSLSTISVESENTHYSSVDGLLLTADMHTLLACPIEKQGSLTIPQGITSIVSYAFATGSKLTNIMLPSGLISIGDQAFWNCTSLTSITIPATVTSIGSDAFGQCSSLGSFAVESGNGRYSSAAGLLLSTDGSTLIAFPAGKQGDVTIAAGMTAIGSHAFSGALLRSVTLPSGVISIPRSAFEDCRLLENITIPSSVISIADYAISGCNSLTAVTFLGDAPQIVSQPFFYSASKATAYYLAGTQGWLSQFGGIPTAPTASPAADFTYAISSGQVTITGYKGSAAVVAIPSTIAGLPVGAIAASAFSDRTALKSVTIPVGITSIGDWAFQSCTSLTNITLPAGLTSIGSSAFSNCAGLTSITLPVSVTSIGDFAFASCTSLTSITLPTGVTKIEAGAFYNCTRLTDISVADGNPSFKAVDGVLYSKDGFQLICCPGGKQGAFSVPQGVTSIDAWAFAICTGLTSVTLPAGLTSIDAWAFSICIGLTSITLPASVTSIAASAFRGCRSLTSVTLPASVTKIEAGAFSHCVILTSISVTDGNPSFKAVDGVLYSKDGSQLICCPGGKQGAFSVPQGVTSIGDSAFYGCRSLTSLTLPAGLTSIASEAFIDCVSLASLTLPASLTSVGSYVFTFCTSLTTVTFLGDAPQLISEQTAFRGSSVATAYYLPGTYGWLSQFGGIPTAQIVSPAADFSYAISSGRVTITRYNGSAEVVVIPETIEGMPVTAIGGSAFFQRTSLTSITLPAGVTGIGDFAFSGCTSLPSITIPASVTSIGHSTFSFCVSLTSVMLPAGIMSIGDSAFNKCTGLTGITIPARVTSIGSNAFGSCTSLTSITLPAGITGIGDFAFSGCTSLPSITIPASVTSIGSGTFALCTSMTSIVVADRNPSFTAVDGVLYDKQGSQLICYPAGKQGLCAVPQVVTSIGDSAFSGCYSLMNITFPTELASIGNSAFAFCTLLTSITLPAGITYIGSKAFELCSNLTSIAVADGNPSFKAVDGVLYDKQGSQLICCPAGKQGRLAVPQGVTSIGHSAFYYCTRLTSVTLPLGVTSIGGAAFAYCAGLTSAPLPLGVTSIASAAFIYCTSLASVTIPASVTSIGYYPFLQCTSLTSVTIPAGVTAIASQAFSMCPSLSTVTFLGDAPQLPAPQTVFYGSSKATAYYLPGKHGWLSQFGGIPTAPITLPSVPGSLSAVRGNTAATLTWATPAFDGYAPISDYVIQHRKTNSPVWSTFQHVASTATTTVVTGLANRQAYVFRVAAINALGQGIWSTQSSAIIPLPTPSAPGRPVGAAGNGVVSLRFAASQATGGLRVTDYVIQYSSNSGASWTTAADSVSPLTTATVRGLSNGTSYVFRVAAVTAGGTGAFSVSSAQGIPYLRTALPAAPTSVVGVGSGGMVSLTWAASSANAGGPIRDYVIQYRSAAAGSRWFTYTDGVTSANAATVRRLIAGRSYIFRVAAKNLAGQGAFSSPSAAITA